MGSKIIFRLILNIFFIACVLTFGNKSFAHTPQSTQPQTQIVRVAINNNGFHGFVYNEISAIATDEYFVYDKLSCKQLLKLNKNDILKIKLSSGFFELFVNEKTMLKTPDNFIIDCPKGLLGVDKLKRAGKQAIYHGYFEIDKKNDAQFFLINILNLEDYLKGVVPNEMPVRFGLEALKAQAVAARNYVLMPRARAFKEFDVDDSVSSQVYFGANTEHPLATQAVEQTEGLVALYGWDLILAQYSSTAGGYTENYENAFSDPKTGSFPAKGKPYLKGRPDIYNVAPLNKEEDARLYYTSTPDSYDMKSPYYRWKKEWTAKELQEILAKTLIDQSKTNFVKPKLKPEEILGELKEIKVKTRGVSGKVMELEIITDKETYHIQKELVIRRIFQKDAISLPSANVVFDHIYSEDKKLDKIVAYGGGFGHGVGMSQFGAGFMATSLNKTFDKILKRYYSGITISTCPVILSSADSQTEIAQNFYAPYKKAVLVVDNKYQLPLITLSINGKEIDIALEKSIVPLNRINRIDISNYVKIGKNTVIFKYPKQELNKGIRLYIELVEKDECEYSF